MKFYKLFLVFNKLKDTCQSMSVKTRQLDQSAIRSSRVETSGTWTSMQLELSRQDQRHDRAIYVKKTYLQAPKKLVSLRRRKTSAGDHSTLTRKDYRLHGKQN